MGIQVISSFPVSQITLQVNNLVGIYLHSCLSILARETFRTRFAGPKCLLMSQCGLLQKYLSLMNSSEIIHQYTFLLKKRKRLLNLILNTATNQYHINSQLKSIWKKTDFGGATFKGHLYFSLKQERGPGKNKSEPGSNLDINIVSGFCPRTIFSVIFQECITNSGCVRIYLLPASSVSAVFRFATCNHSWSLFLEKGYWTLSAGQHAPLIWHTSTKLVSNSGQSSCRRSGSPLWTSLVL